MRRGHWGKSNPVVTPQDQLPDRITSSSRGIGISMLNNKNAARLRTRTASFRRPATLCHVRVRAWSELSA